MIHVCISEPVSYLRLERYLLDDMAPREKSEVSTHLSKCQACQECFETLRIDTAELLPLPSEPRTARHTARKPQRVKRLGMPVAAMTAFAAAAAALLLARTSDEPSTSLGLTSAGVKGNGLAVSLIREHEGSISVDASHFASGDRFEVRISCASSQPMYWDLAVFQRGQAFYPLQPNAPLHCGNNVTLPGAFRLTGNMPTRVCVIMQARVAVNRAQIGRALRDASTCMDLAPTQPR